MIKTKLSSCLFLKNIEGKGRGVFTKKNILADSIIEVSPVIVMSDNDRHLLDQTLLHDYIFEWKPLGQNLCCMALGFIPVYNHSFNSNCEYFMNYEDNTIMIKTITQVIAGDELTINYNGDWNDEKSVWFEVHK